MFKFKILFSYFTYYIIFLNIKIVLKTCFEFFENTTFMIPLSRILQNKNGS